MKKSIFTLSIAMFLVFFTTSCQVNFSNGVSGNGDVIHKTFNLDQSFTGVSSSSGWDVKLKKSTENKIEVSTDENIMPLFSHKIENGMLKISSKKSINRSKIREAVVYYTEELQQLHASSGSELSSAEVFEQKNLKIDASSGADLSVKLKTESTSVDISSGAEVSLNGTCINFTVDASSGSELKAKNLKTKNSNLDASSGASIDVEVAETLTADTSSGADITYYGKPSKINYDESISGSLKHK